MMSLPFLLISMHYKGTENYLSNDVYSIFIGHIVSEILAENHHSCPGNIYGLCKRLKGNIDKG